MAQKSVRRQSAGGEHKFIALTLPPARAERRVTPFTAMVLDMPADAGRALVYHRPTDEAITRASAMCGAAIRAARRRDPGKIFQTRLVTHDGVETCAVWRIK